MNTEQIMVLAEEYAEVASGYVIDSSGGSYDKARAALQSAIEALQDRLKAAEKDAARLDWVISNPHMRVKGLDKLGWHVLDCSNGLTFVVRGEGTYRSAIDAAMEAK